ncbi:MAG: MotA/TolQ/ExbB proton channel family protein [Oleiphilaceae bacterium]|nr:MotA/TolQ/ExbB proton channel family protein [Oleiphilaceae bacterium]
MGGPVMLVLIALGVAGLVTFIYLILSGALFAPRFSSDISKAIAGWQQQPDQRWPEQLAGTRSWWARINPLRPLAIFAMNACLDRKHPTSIREELACRSHKILQPFEAPLKIIEVIAALAPLLGLLGTVMGMMQAFSAMSAAEGQASASQLSGGIYEALTTTAAGLVLAIPFAAIAAWTEFRLRRLNTQLNDALVRIITTDLPASDAQNPEKEAPAVRIPAGTESVDTPTQKARMAYAAD